MVANCMASRDGALVDEPYAQSLCTVCGWIYGEEQGLPEAGIPPGTRWEDVPQDFLYPACGEPRSMFERVDIRQEAP